MANVSFGKGLRCFEDRWDGAVASKLDPVELLCYRTNLLGAELRIAPSRHGCTSSKIDQADAINGNPVRVMCVKGSGGALGSVKTDGFGAVYLHLFQRLENLYSEDAAKDEMTPLYPLVSLGSSPATACAETPLHAFLPADHVDHLFPEWGASFASARDGKRMVESFNQAFQQRVVWVPSQKSCFGLGLRLRKVVQETPGCTGITLGGRSWMSWGRTQRECYLNSLRLMDQLAQFAEQRKASPQGHWEKTFAANEHFIAAAPLGV